MKTFFYTVSLYRSTLHHYRTVKVYRIIRNVPKIIGYITDLQNQCRESDEVALMILREQKQIPKADISPTTGKANFQLIYLNVL